MKQIILVSVLLAGCVCMGEPDKQNGPIRVYRFPEEKTTCYILYMGNGPAISCVKEQP